MSEEPAQPKIFTTASGAPVEDNQNSITAGPLDQGNSSRKEAK
jgi:hypothetical protein